MKLIDKTKTWFSNKIKNMYLSDKERYYKFLPINDDAYDMHLTKEARGKTYAIMNPIEVVYIALQKVYDKYVPNLRISGISVSFTKDIIVTITLFRPGLLIGRAGRDIDKFQSVLEELFKVSSVTVNLKEDKTLFYISVF